MASSRRLFSSFHRLRQASFPLLSHHHFSPSPKPPKPTSQIPPIRPAPESFRPCGGRMGFSSGTVTLVIREGKPKFDTLEYEPPKKEKWVSKKRLKMKRMREKKKRREANTKDPRCLRQKGTRRKPRFPDAEARLEYKIEKAKIKEASLVEILKKYEVPKLQGPLVKPEMLTGEERFYMKKMAQKRSNYVPVGRRGVFGGVVLNMHLHWKKHETVKVICKPCKPGQIHEYAREIARLSGGTPIQVIGDDTIIFYRGKNYVQPEVMSPVDTLSKKRALEKSKYEQSLETVRHFIAISEKELELYYRHVALYGNHSSRNPKSGPIDQKETSNLLHPSTQSEEIYSDNTNREFYSNSKEVLESSSECELTSTSEDDSEEDDSEEGSEGEGSEESNHTFVCDPYSDSQFSGSSESRELESQR